MSGSPVSDHMTAVRQFLAAFTPDLFVRFRKGYGLDDLRADCLAGLTVAFVAFPLSMALAIASGTTPENGLVTAIVAGFLISFFGGSRVQIGGPTGAFVVIVVDVIARHGYDGLVIATFMAGLIVVAAGFLRLGTFIKYIPQPVVVGFTAGIAVIIFSSQMRDFFGLDLATLPGGVVDQWATYAEHMGSLSPVTLAVALASLGTIMALRRFRPRWPGMVIVILAGSLAVGLLSLPVETIGTRFGTVSATLPMPHVPELSFARITELMPAALTIAFLAALESLLSAMVADSMTQGRHNSNAELVAQGIANIGSALFGGLPATGAIARTATNIRSGARTPVSGLVHAALILAFLLLFAGLLVHVPMAVLAAILVMVAWNMSERHHVAHLLTRAPTGDRVLLVVTFVLTIAVDLTAAIEVGVLLGALLFMHRMAETVVIETSGGEGATDGDEPAQAIIEDARRAGIEIIHIQGPLFFGVATQLLATFDRMATWPRAIVVRMDKVSFVDSTGVAALKGLVDRCHARSTPLVLCDMSRHVRHELVRGGVLPHDGVRIVKSLEAALDQISGRAHGNGDRAEAADSAPIPGISTVP